MATHTSSILKKFESLSIETITLNRTQRIFLNNEKYSFFVSEGSLNIFFLFPHHREESDLNKEFGFYQELALNFTPFLSDLVEGNLLFSANAQKFDLLFPFSFYAKGGYPLVIATAYENTTLLCIPTQALSPAAAEDRFFNLYLIHTIQKWSRSHFEQVNQIEVKKAEIFIEEPQELIFPAASTLRLVQYPYDLHQNKLWTFKIEHGLAELFDMESAVVSPEIPHLILTPQIWLKAIIDSNVQIELKDDITTFDFVSTLLFLNDCLTKRAKERLQYRIELEKKAFEENQNFEKELQDKTKALLAGPLNEISFLKNRDISNPLLRVLLIATKNMNQELAIPSNFLAQKQDSTFEKAKFLCIVTTTFYYDISLPPGWLHNSSVPLVVFTKAKPMKPLAAIPDKKQLKLINYGEKIEPISKEEEIYSRGLALYRSFPNKTILNWKDILQFLYKLIRSDFHTILLTGTLLGLSALLYPISLQMLFDGLLQYHDFNLVASILALLVVVEIGKLLFQITEEYAILRLEAKIDHDWEMAMWQRILLLPAYFFHLYESGDLMQRISSIGTIRKTFSTSISRILIKGFFSILFLAVMFLYSVQLTLIVLALLLVYFFGISLFIPMYLKLTYVIQKSLSTLNSSILQVILGISKIRTNGSEQRIFYRWSKAKSQLATSEIKLGKIEALLAGINGFIPYFLQVVVLGYLIYSAETNKTMTIGAFLAFYAAFSNFSSGILSFGNFIFLFTSLIPIWKQGEVILKAESEFDTSKEYPGILQGEVRLDSISFRYSPSMPQVIKNFSFHIKPGEFVAIIGPSGCGKSSLVRILLGLEKPEQGAVYYDGKDLATLSLNQVRRQIGVFLQHSAIFDGTIKSNILCGHDASEEELDWAIEMAGFAEDLLNLPMKLRTVLTNGGNTLSGGQKQRLMIARALIKKPKILILDEATNALDNKTQNIIMKNLEKLEVTRIVIAHRLSTIKNAGHIIIMENGQLSEQGTYTDLLEKSERFEKYVTLQSSEES